MLTLESVSHGFSGHRVLEGINCQLVPGEIICIVGPSGCGKSTLLRLAGGLLRPDEGAVIDHFDSHAFVFQEPRLLPWRNVVDNVSLDRYPEAAEGILTELGLGDWLSTYPHQLSGGMQQRAAIARALAPDPACLLLDEPFGALDPARRVELQSELRQRCIAARRAALFVTHDLTEAARLGDRILVLGGTPARIFERIEGCTAAEGDADAYEAAAAMLQRPAVRRALGFDREKTI